MTPKAKTTLRFKVVYGFAHGGKSLFWHASELFFAYFLTEACGLPPKLMGLALGGSLVLSAATDLLTGVLLNRRVHSLRAAGSCQLVGTLISAVAFCVFACTSLVSPAPLRLTLAIAALIVFRTSYSLVDNPQNAMLGLATRSDEARAALASLRYVFSGLANIIVAVAFVPMFQTGSARAHAAHFIVFAVLISLAAATSSTILWLHLRRSPVVFGERQIMAPCIADLKPASRLWPILLIMFLVTVAMSVFSRLEPYFAAYGMPTALQGGTLLTCVAVGGMAAQPAWAKLARRISLRSIFLVACMAMALGSAAFAVLAGHGFGLSILAGGLYGVASGGVLMSLWALTASAAGARSTASFGALTCASKLALALSALFAGEFLKTVPYHSLETARVWLLPVMTISTGLVACATLILGVFLLKPPSYRTS